MRISKSFLFLGFFLFCEVSATLYNVQSLLKSRNADKDLIYVRGKYFYRNGTSTSISAKATTQPQYFSNCVDQTDGRCTNRWNQRYWVNRNYYRSGGPIFYMLGPEGDADGSVDSFYWLYYAREFGALLVCIEHRFYGKSYPTRDTSLKSLQLLTSQQALADASRFIRWFKQQNKLTGAKTVVFGGSYGGNLAAWFRQKYPQDANLAVASSGPIVAKFDMSEYLQKVSEVIYWNNPECYDAIYQVFDCMGNIVHGRDSSCSTYTRQQLPKAVHMCYNINFDDEMDKQYFFNTMAMSPWASNYPAQQDLPRCQTLLSRMQSNDNVIDAYGQFLQDINQAGPCSASSDDNGDNDNGDTSGSEAFSVSEENSSGGKNISDKGTEVLNFINSDAGIMSGAAGWFWQTCYEFGYFMTADPKYGIFGRDFSTLTYVSQCQQQYGNTFTSQYIQNRITQTNNYYKGRSYDGSCTIFVNGEYDPWSLLGINQASETSSRNSVVFIPKAEHCEDMNRSQKKDTIQAQSKIQNLIGKYLKDSSC